MWSAKKDMFVNKPISTPLSSQTKSSMEKLGPVVQARPIGFEIGSTDRGEMQYIPSRYGSVPLTKYKY